TINVQYIYARRITLFHELIMGTINNTNNISCVQINLNTCKASTAHLTQHIIENNIDIVFIQEHYVYKSTICGCNKYQLYYDKSHGNSRSAILIANNSINAIFIHSYSSNILTVSKCE